MDIDFVVSSNKYGYFNNDSYIAGISRLIKRVGCGENMFTQICYKFNYIEPSLDDFIAMINFFVSNYDLGDKTNVEFCDPSAYDYKDDKWREIKNLKEKNIKEEVYKYIKNKADNEDICIDINNMCRSIGDLFSVVNKFNDILKVTYNRKYFEPHKYNAKEQKQMLFELIEKYNEVYRRVFKEKNRNMVCIINNNKVMCKVEANELARKLNEIIIKKGMS